MIPRLPFSWSLPRLRRPPLPFTAVVVAALLVGPLVALQRLPRPRAQGLERLVIGANLIQSFPATPDRPVPMLWRQRLGDVLARRIWRQQRRSWWQYWGGHSEAGAHLVLSSASLVGIPPSALPSLLVQVDDLVVIPPEALSRQLLVQALNRPTRQPRGLSQACLHRLRTEQAVAWDATALSVILGPIVPLLEPLQVGCLGLSIEAEGLAWRGEAAARGTTPLSKADAAALSGLVGSHSPPPPLASDLLLQLEGGSLDSLLKGLLARQLIREPLEQRYGFAPRALARLRQMAFRLRLRSVAQGPFRAVLELQLISDQTPRSWGPILEQMRQSLRQQGLSELKAAGQPAAGPETLPTASWRDASGRIVGGWRWVGGVGRAPQLVLFLGSQIQGVGLGDWMDPRRMPLATDLLLRSRPSAMAAEGLVPPAMPSVLQRADQLWITSRRLSGPSTVDPVHGLVGELRLGRILSPGPIKGVPPQAPPPPPARR